MRKILLLLTANILGITLTAQTTTQDFEYQNIQYTIVDENAKTCITKAGSFVNTKEPTERPYYELVYGNTLSGNITIPEKVSNGDTQYTVIGIGDCGFSGISGIQLPESLLTIGQYAFFTCSNLQEITIPSGVTSIGAYSFYNCTSLTNVTLPTGLTVISDYLFSHCENLENINLPSSIISIGENAFSSSGITSITLPSAVTQIGTNAFAGCTNLMEVNIPDGISSLPANVFYNCSSLTSIEIPENVTQIGALAFSGCRALTSVICSNHTPPAISNNAFSNYSAITLSVPNSSLTAYQKNTIWGSFGTITAIPMATTGIYLDKSVLNLEAGISGQLKATIEPLDATEPIVWTSTSEPAGVITVNSSGKVMTSGIGTGTVTATSGSFSASCEVTVSKNSTISIYITPLDNPVYVGDEIVMTATVTPSTITDPVLWSISNPEIATINEKTGALTALSPGGAVITARCEDRTSKYSLTVNPIEAESITLSQNSLTMEPTNTETLTATIMPENTTFKTVSWTSSDESVAIVSDGVITAIAPGSATITAVCGYATAICEVTVNEVAAQKIELNIATLTLKAMQSQQLTATVLPENTTNKTVTWSSGNPEIVTVSIDGTVTAVKYDSSNTTASIYATCGDITATCTVSVEETPATEVTISMIAATLKIGQSQQLFATVGEDVSVKTITWSSSNSEVATVTSEGLVSAVSTGTATITATCGTVSAKCEITVEETLAEQVIPDESNITINVGESMQINVTILPETTTDKTLVWSTDNEEVVSVVNGKITGVSPGSAVVTISCGPASAICNVTVLSPAKSITLNYTALTLPVGDMEDLIATIEPSNTTDIVYWYSSNTDVVSVNEHGIVEALSAGTATITVECGSVSAECNITVLNSAISVTLNYTELTLKVGETEALIATIVPANTTDEVFWYSSNTAVASVNEQGIVEALSAGTATITVECGSVSADCKVTVTDDSTSSIDSVTTDGDGFYRVYNLQGVNVVNTKDIDVVNNLSPGIYIINRKKILIQ